MTTQPNQSSIFQQLTSLFPRWTSPEALERGKYTQMSDVWAFGITMWEIFSEGIIPYASMSNAEVLPFLKSGKRLEQPNGMITNI